VSHWLAAVLACGSRAVLSHRSAAALWEIRPSAAATLEVTVPTQNGRLARRGLRIHRSGRLGASEVTLRGGIATTTVARTLLDLMDVLPTRSVKRAIDESEYRGLFGLTAVLAVVESNAGRRGRRLLELAQDPAQLTRSELEDRFLDIVSRHGLPQPLTNHAVLGYRVDVLFPRRS
jgi:predicted transcriptional regulator of viral defense system